MSLEVSAGRRRGHNTYSKFGDCIDLPMKIISKSMVLSCVYLILCFSIYDT